MKTEKAKIIMLLILKYIYTKVVKNNALYTFVYNSKWTSYIYSLINLKQRCNILTQNTYLLRHVKCTINDHKVWKQNINYLKE